MARRGRRRIAPSLKRSEALRLYLTPGEMKMIVSAASKNREDYRDWAKRVLLSSVVS